MNVETALGRYLETVDSVAPGLVEGLYIVGSYALDMMRATATLIAWCIDDVTAAAH